MNKHTLMAGDAAIERALAALLVTPPTTGDSVSACAGAPPAPRAAEPLADPAELIDPFDRLEVELELGIPARGSLARLVADQLAAPGAPVAAPDDVAQVVGLAAALAPRLHFNGAAPCHLRPDDADAVGLGVAEYEAANFGISVVAAVPRLLADKLGPVTLSPARADTALFVATAAHYRIGIGVPFIGVIARLLLRLLRLLWRLIRNLFRLRKRVQAASRLRNRWAADVAAGTMTRAQYLAKLAGLIATLTAEIDALAALILSVQDEIRAAEEELEGVEDDEAKRKAEAALEELRKQLDELRRQKEALEQEKRDAERERDTAQQGGG